MSYLLNHKELDRLKESVRKLELLNYEDNDLEPIDFLYSILDGKISGIENRFMFLKNSLFCSYAYIINLDEDRLEFYKGANKEFDGSSPLPFSEEDRFGEWFPVKFVCSYGFNNWPEDFEKVINDFTFKISENIV